MLFTTPGQYLVLAILLVAGWLLGLASHPGGKKWKARYYAERDARAEERRDREARIEELKRENANLASRTVTPVAAAAAAPATYERRPSRGWFAWGSPDDLTQIKGVDQTIADRLRAERYGSFSALKAMSSEDEAALEQRLDLPAGRIARDRWREQAAMLAAGNHDGWRQRFG